MTEASLQRIAAHYELLAGRMQQLTQSFYRNLFEAAPETRPLFRIDIDLQSQHLAAALALIVRNLRLLDVLEQPLMELGASHADVGVRPEHYPIVCQTMVKVLAEESAGAWSGELQADWSEALESVSKIMMNGAIRRHSSPAQKRDGLPRIFSGGRK